MPWSEKQHNYFEALAHGMKSKKKGAPSKEEAAKLAAEGIKRSDKKSVTDKLYKKSR